MQRMIRNGIAIIAVVALLAVDLHATNRKKVSVKCPVDGTSVSAWEVVSKTDWGGIDTDLCRHEYSGVQPNDLYVWVCPTCYYASDHSSFTKEISDNDEKVLTGALKPMETIKKNASQDDIPGWVKYDLLAQKYQLLGKEERLVAEAYTRASWSVRQNGMSKLADFDEFEAIRERYHLNLLPYDFQRNKTYKEKYGGNRTFYELEKVKDIEKDIASGKVVKSDLLFAKYLAANIYRTHGENGQSLKWLTQLQKETGQNSVIDNAVVEALKSIETETNFQKKAIQSYVAALDKGLFTKEQTPEAQYLIGELSRRIQDDKTAIEWFDKCIANPDAKQYKPWSEIQKSLIASPTPSK